MAFTLAAAKRLALVMEKATGARAGHTRSRGWTDHLKERDALGRTGGECMRLRHLVKTAVAERRVATVGCDIGK